MENLSFYIDQWLIEPSVNRISRDGDEVELAPKEMEFLFYLAQRPGIVVAKEELLREVWGEVIVNDNTIARVVANLRKALGDDWQHPRFIQTISKSGYRLIAPVNNEPKLARNYESSFKRTYFVSGVAFAVIAAVIWSFTRTQPALDVLTPVPLTSLPGREIQGELSPTGNMLAFVWEGEDQNNWDIYVKLVGTEDVQRLTSNKHTDVSPSWTSDGRHIVFVRYQEGGDCGIYKITALGGDEVKLTDCNERDITSAQLSPDGKYVLFTERPEPDRPVAVVLYSLESSEKQFISQPASGSWGDLQPGFSPDGSQIVWRRIEGEGIQDIYVASVEGDQPRKLTSVKRFIRGLDWTSDGSEIVYSSTSGGQWRMWSVPVKGGDPKPLAINHTDLSHPSVVKNHMVYVQNRPNNDIWKVNVKSNELQAIVRSSYQDEHPSLSHQEDGLAFTSNRSGSHELWVRDLLSGSEKKLTAFEDTYVSNPIWSADDRLIVFEVRVGGYIHLFKVDREGGNLLQLTEGSNDNFAPSWGEKHLYFTSNKSGDWEIWRSPHERGLTSFNENSVRVSNNGGFSSNEMAGRLYITKYGENGLWSVDPETGDEKKLIPDLDWFDWSNWYAMDGYIIHYNRGSDEIGKYSIATDTAVNLFQVEKPLSAFFRSFIFSSDLSEIYYTQEENRGSDIMLVENWR